MDSRKTTILDMLVEELPVSVRDLARRFEVSEMTIRRDLDELQRQGFLVRTHGGAVSTARLRFLQAGMPSARVSPEKTAIARTTAGLLGTGQTVMIDTGTTSLEVARHIGRDSGLTVVTTSLCVAQELYSSPVSVLLLGGFLRKEFPSVYGPLTEKTLGDLRVDAVVMGCDGADSASGFYTDDLHISSLEQVMISIADRVIVVTESVKFGRRAFARYATLEQVDTLVTDSGLSDQDRAALKEHGVGVVIADCASV